VRKPPRNAGTSQRAVDWHEPRKRLLAWYDQFKRDLPWRRTRDPYAIWVSEIMLQQTRVDTVVPYFGRFLARFPTVQTLADAPLDAVLAQWSGLGYYRRARLLHQGAQAVAREHAGRVPESAVARLALPGVGRYTAGAIGSIAFDLPEPIVDGNVARVLTRVLGVDTPLGDKRTERVLWEEAARLAQGERPGALNQAVMELGARICTPTQAKCESCPLAGACLARREGRVSELPVVPAKRAPKAVALVGLVARTTDQRLWLARNEGNLYGGLWGCPLEEGHSAATASALAERLALRGTLSPHKLGSVEHVLTHRRLSIDVYEMTGTEGEVRADLRAVHPHELEHLGIARLTHKLLACAAQPLLPGVATRQTKRSVTAEQAAAKPAVSSKRKGAPARKP
jgi:A/G-specific adenine glycosylase